MSKGAKGLKGKADRISAGISSGNLVDLQEFKNQSVANRLKNFIKNRVALNQSETVFLDYKRKTFPEVARNQYHKVFEAYRKKDKVDLMKFLSIPMFDLFKACIKEKKELPFYLYEEVLDVKLIQARIYSMHKHNLNPNQTWHQMTMKFTCKDIKTTNEVFQFNVFERREADTNINDWRLCHIE